MNRNEILDRLRELLHREIGYRGPVEPESELAADLGLDSLKLLTLVVELENSFKVAIEPAEGEEPPTTVGQVVDLIERGLAAGEAAA
jgi:acyl carrier protein